MLASSQSGRSNPPSNQREEAPREFNKTDDNSVLGAMTDQRLAWDLQNTTTQSQDATIPTQTSSGPEQKTGYQDPDTDQHTNN